MLNQNSTIHQIEKMDFVQLLRDSNSPNNQKRSQAEKHLLEARTEHPCLFFMESTKHFFDIGLELQFRVKAGTLAKYSLLNLEEVKALLSIVTFKGDAEKVWMSFPQDSREYIKNMLLSSLASFEDNIQSLAIDVISMIWGIEFPNDQWRDLIANLVTNANHMNEKIKKVAIAAVEGIARTIRGKKFVLNEETINQILSCFVIALQQENQNQEIARSAVRGLKDILFSVQETLKKKENRQVIMEQVIQCALNGEKFLKQAAMEFIAEYLLMFFESFEDFYQPIWEITSSLVGETDIELAASAIHVWVIIVSEYKQRVNDQKNKAPNVLDFDAILQMIQAMIPILLQTLLKNAEIKEQEGYEEEEISTITETRECLNLISKVTTDHMIQYATKFMETYITSSNPFEIYSSLIVYESILDEACINSLYPIVSSILPVLVNIVVHYTGLSVKEEASKALNVTAKVIPQIFFEQEHEFRILPAIVSLIESKPQISMHIMEMWHYLSANMAKSLRTRKIDFDLCSLIDLILVNACRDISPSYYSLIDYSFTTIMSLIICLPSDDQKIKYINILIQTLRSLGDMDQTRSNQIQSGIFSCIQVALFRLQIKGNLTAGFCQDIMELIDNVLINQKELKAEATHLLAGLVTAMGPNFEVYFDKTWIYLNDCLRRHDQTELFFAASSAVVEIASACPHMLSPYLGEILPNLCNFINNPNAERNIKINLISCIGDIILGCKESVAPFITELLSIYEQAMNASIQIVKMDNSELEDFLDDLRHATIESLITLIWGTSECLEIHGEITKFLPSVLGFVQQICTRELNPTQNLVNDCMALLNDITLIYKVKDRLPVQPDFPNQLMLDIQELQTKMSGLLI